MCDTLAAVPPATSSGAVLFAKNSDREYSEAQHLVLVPAAHHSPDAEVKLTYQRIAQARQTHTVLLSKPHWMWGAEIGANEHGLVVGNEAVFAKIEPSMTPGIIGMDYLRLALERARDVDEAISVITTLLREHGQSGNCGFQREITYHNSFILADYSGARILETVEREWVVKPIERYDAISNAITIDEVPGGASPTLESRAIEGGFHEPGARFAFKSVYGDPGKVGSAGYRRGRMLELLGNHSGELQTTDLFDVLRDHQEGEPTLGVHGPRLCAHIREHPLGQTTASWVSSLITDKAVHWVTGTAAACTGLFKPVVIQMGLPAHGTVPGAPADSTSLWWRHEQIRRYLDDSEPAVRNEFLGARNALEALFLRETAQCPPVVDVESRESTQRVIEHCWSRALAFEDQWFEKAARR
jgi:secernin